MLVQFSHPRLSLRQNFMLHAALAVSAFGTALEFSDTPALAHVLVSPHRQVYVDIGVSETSSDTTHNFCEIKYFAVVPVSRKL